MRNLSLSALLLVVATSLPDKSVSQEVCQIFMDSSDWPENPPIITDADGDEENYVLPDGSYELDDRVIELNADQDLLVSCSGGTVFDNSALGDEGFYYATIVCVEDTTFDVTTAFEMGQYDFSELGCEEPVDEETFNTGVACGPKEEGVLIDIGFRAGEEQLVPTVTACFVEADSKTLYTFHDLPREILARQTGNDRPDFKADDYYPFSVAEAYEVNSQQAVVADQLGSTSLAEDYIDDPSDSDFYLARGHASPNSDFVYYSHQDSTYYYINAVPQWQSINAYNWLYVEDGVRKFVEDQGRDLVVYTGTNGVMELEDSDGNKVPIYLYLDDGELGDRLPVPMFVWKLMVDPDDEVAIGIVSVNNPHLTLDEVDDDYRVCDPVPDHPMMFYVDEPDDLSKGVTYACEYDDLRSAFEEVPDLGDLGILL